MYKFKASETFWKKFYALPDSKKASAREKWKSFKVDPFDTQLKVHKINRLTALHRTTVYGFHLEDDLIVVFKIVDGDTVYTIDIDNHDVYR